MLKSDETLLNEQIKYSSIRVSDSEGNQLGIMSSRDAYSIALRRNLDLVLVAPNANPPVCKIIDWGKHLFELKKKKKAAKSKQTVIETKEIQLRPTTDKHDIETKLRHAQKFIEKGKHVRFNMRFRGRENTHVEIGMKVMNNIIERFGDSVTIEKQPVKNGNSLTMVFSPNK